MFHRYPRRVPKNRGLGQKSEPIIPEKAGEASGKKATLKNHAVVSYREKDLD